MRFIRRLQPCRFQSYATIQVAFRSGYRALEILKGFDIGLFMGAKRAKTHL